MQPGCSPLPRSAAFRRYLPQRPAVSERIRRLRAIRNQQVIGSSPIAGSKIDLGGFAPADAPPSRSFAEAARPRRRITCTTRPLDPDGQVVLRSLGVAGRSCAEAAQLRRRIASLALIWGASPPQIRLRAEVPPKRLGRDGEWGSSLPSASTGVTRLARRRESAPTTRYRHRSEQSRHRTRSDRAIPPA